MSDSTHPPQAVHQRGKVWRVVRGAGVGLFYVFRLPYAHRGVVMLLLSWAAPALVMWTGYYFFSDLSVPATWPLPDNVYKGMFVQLAVILAWMIYEIWWTVYRNTAVWELQLDTFGDFVTTSFLIYIIGILSQQGAVPFWYLVPFFGSFLDAALSSLFAINNAAQKPGIGAKTGT